MDPHLKTAWIQALRSGNFQQTRGHLRSQQADGTLLHCANGVLLELILTPEQRQRMPHNWPGYLPLESYDQTGLSHTQESLIASLNDAGKTFTEIADIIERDIDSEPALVEAVNREIERIRTLVSPSTTSVFHHFNVPSAPWIKLTLNNELITSGFVS